MTKARSAIDCPLDPIGLSLEEAAALVGVSPGTYDKLCAEGVMPPPRLLGTRRIWSVDEIRRAFARVPHDLSGLKPGVSPPQHKPDSDDPYDRPPRA